MVLSVRSFRLRTLKLCGPGAAAVFPPGTVIAEAAKELLEKLLS